jgi:DNA polymerase-3 subunit delta
LKYQNVNSFDKHIKEAFPDHLSSIYLVASSCNFERKELIKKITSNLMKKHGTQQVALYDATDTAEKVVLNELNTHTLFGGGCIVVYDKIDRLKDFQQLIRYVIHPNRDCSLILGVTNMKVVSPLYQQGKKEIVVLDLTEEKSWDRRRRLNEWLFEIAKQHNKTLQTDAALFLIDHIGSDMATLYHEVHKLLCYVGDRPSISLCDVKTICCIKNLQTIWQQADGVIWEGATIEAYQKNDLSFLLPFIGQLRHQLQMGYQLAENVFQSKEVSRLFPLLKPQTFDRYLAIARQKKRGYFHKGLVALFDLEVHLKSSGLDISLLFDRFISKLNT